MTQSVQLLRHEPPRTFFIPGPEHYAAAGVAAVGTFIALLASADPIPLTSVYVLFVAFSAFVSMSIGVVALFLCGVLSDALAGPASGDSWGYEPVSAKTYDLLRRLYDEGDELTRHEISKLRAPVTREAVQSVQSRLDRIAKLSAEARVFEISRLSAQRGVAK